MESYFAALKLRAVPFNVNYRYTAEEIAYLLDNADADALVYHSSLAEVVAAAVGRARSLKAAARGRRRRRATSPGSIRYEDAIAGAEPAPRIEREPGRRHDDLHRRDDRHAQGRRRQGRPAAGRPARDGPAARGPRARSPIDDMPAFAAALEATGDVMVSLPAPPLMHNTGLAIGATPALAHRRHHRAARRTGSSTPPSLWDTVAAERVNAITVVGDAFARPMLAALDANPGRDLSVRAGHRVVRRDVLERGQDRPARPPARGDDPRHHRRERRGDGRVDRHRRLHPPTPAGSSRRPASSSSPRTAAASSPAPTSPAWSRCPAAPRATTRTTPRRRRRSRSSTVGATRSRATSPRSTPTAASRCSAAGSSCINTAGEKVYPEEVEEVLKAQPAVEDALVFGVRRRALRPAGGGGPVAARRDATSPSTRSSPPPAQRLAAYKVPRAVVVVDEVPRTQVGKPDYPTARELFARGITSTVAPSP